VSLLSRRLRRVVRLTHLALSLGVGVVAIVLGLSGSVLVFREEIRHSLAPVPAWDGQHAAPWTTVRDQARAAVPGGVLQTLWFPTRARPFYEAAYKVGDREFVEPRRWAASTGVPIPVDDVAWLSWLEELHVSLHLGEIGRQIVGWSTLSLAVLLATGLYLWWPGWKPWLWCAVRARGWLLTFDLHRVAGLLATAPLAVMTASGLVWAFPDASRTLAFGLVGQRPPGLSARTLGDVRSTPPAHPVVPVSDEDLLARARARVAPDAFPFYITYPVTPDESRQVRLQRGYAPWPYGEVLRVYFDQYDGTIVALDVPDEKHIVDAALDAWAAPLHFGTFGGRASMMLYVVAGTAPLLLGATGLLLWRWRVARARDTAVTRGGRFGVPEALPPRGRARATR
jgi:uncharacterized iron-regulated membrane protein